MDGVAGYSIGELAGRTGLTVKTIRYYSDRGIVPPVGRAPSGHRRFGADAVARLELVRTLRELGLDLPTIRKVVDREAGLREVAAAHAEALAVQIRTLRLRHAVLTAVARRGCDPEEMELVHRLARLTREERDHLIDDFLETAFGALAAEPTLTAALRSMRPDLPDDSTGEQIGAWAELAGLCQDGDFRASMGRMAEHHAEDHPVRTTARIPAPDCVAMALREAGPAVTEGLDPRSPQAAPIVAAVTEHYARTLGIPDDGGLRRRLLSRLEIASDPRRARYLRLLSVINGWPVPEDPAPRLEWFVQALRIRLES